MPRCKILLLLVVVCLCLLTRVSVGDCGGCGYAACGSCGEVYGADFCSRPPCAFGTMAFDILALNRSGVDDQDVLFAAGGFGNALLNNRDLNLDPEAGFRFDLMLEGNCGCDLNFNLMGVHDFSDAQTRSDANLAFVFFDLVPAVPVNSYTVVYSSQLTSGELNVRSRQWPRLAPLAGFRVFDLKEEFNIFEAGTSTGFFSEADNLLFGLQFGFQAMVWEHNRWTIESTFKAGAYYNQLHLNASALDAAGAAIALDGRFQHTAFVGELQVVAMYHLSPRSRLRIGYQGMWVDGVALAPDQSDTSSFFSRLVTPDPGTAIYQGGFLGYEISW